MYVLGKDTRSPFENVGATMFFYRPPNFIVHRLKDDKELESIVGSSSDNFLVVRDRSVAMVLPGNSAVRRAIGLHDVSALGRKIQLVQLAGEFEAIRPVFDRRAINGGDGPSSIDLKRPRCADLTPRQVSRK